MEPGTLRLSEFDYILPKELIAQYPLASRDEARLMVIDRRRSTIEHSVFKDIYGYLRKNDLLILNDTKVLTARIAGKRITGGKVEVLLLKRKQGLTFEAMLKPARLKIGERIIFNGEKTEGLISGRNEVTFNLPSPDSVYSLGSMPLPPYIKRQATEKDDVYYQTVYARNEGAVASPTAGLHFTQELLQQIESKGVKLGFITLHVGAGTFKPVKSDDITRHKMESEYFTVPEQARERIEEARGLKSRIIAVGTTSLRALETYATGKQEGFTDLFIYPGYKFNLVEALLTNFHLPKTTLFMLVCAFCAAGASAYGGAGLELVKQAYQEAIERKYRFYSYGDAMLII